MNQAFLGIDISKKTFDVALLVKNDAKAKKFNNNKQGFLKLLTWINNKEIILSQACMEATGPYGEALAEFLYNHNIPISVINPARIKGFSQSELARNKNDILDAKLIGRFCKLMKPKLWEPTPEKTRVLQQWVRRLDDLIAMHRMEENRLEVADNCLKADLRKHINSLKNQIKKAKEMIKDHINKHEDLKNKSVLLQSIPGIGDATIAQILAFIGDPGKFQNAKEVAAFLGLNPRQRQSGSSVNGRTRLSKTGDSALRKAFYMPAVVAMRHNPILKEFKDRLEKAGKCKMVIIGAIMRKLVHIIYGVLKNKTAFNENILKLA
jgi:transposase